MKMPKIKKMSKLTKLRLAEIGTMIVYTVAAGAFGILNYQEGLEAEWKYLTDHADAAEGGAVGFNDKDGSEYILAGKSLTKRIMDMSTKNDEEDNS